MTPKLTPLGCWVCGAFTPLYYIHLGGGQFDTRPVHIGSTTRKRTKVCFPCGDALLKDTIERVYR